MLQLQDKGASGTAPATRMLVSAGARALGELLITAGIILVLFIGWQLWWTNVESDAAQRGVVRDFVRQLDASSLQETPGAGTSVESMDGPVVVAAEPAAGETIGLLYVPRFGGGYTRPIVQGTGPSVLDTLGVGHYEGTSMPGAEGNFALAGHRQTHGAVLDDIETLVPGDRIYVQTRDGYYVYLFRNSEIVLPTRTDVLLPVPNKPAASPREAYLTMTSCNPRFGSQERFIAYATLERWQPASAGPPADIAAQAGRTIREE